MFRLHENILTFFFPGKCVSRVSVSWSQNTILLYGYKNSSAFPARHSIHANIKWTDYREYWATIKVWCWVYSDHQVLFYWRDCSRLQIWHCLYGENMCSMYILTVMAPLFVKSINWLHWSIYHRSVICLFQVLSRGVIIHHGYEKVEVKSSNGAASGTVSFKLSVGADLAPAVQILAYCVLPSENIVARSTTFDIEKCFKNKECKKIYIKKHICPFTLIMVILAQY